MPYDCPFCAWKTENGKALLQHLAMAKRSHAVLHSDTFSQYKALKLRLEILGLWNDHEGETELLNRHIAQQLQARWENS